MLTALPALAHLGYEFTARATGPTRAGHDGFSAPISETLWLYRAYAAAAAARHTHVHNHLAADRELHQLRLSSPSRLYVNSFGICNCCLLRCTPLRVALHLSLHLHTALVCRFSFLLPAVSFGCRYLTDRSFVALGITEKLHFPILGAFF